MSHGGLLDLFFLLVLEAQNPISTLTPQFVGRNKGRDPARRPFRQTGLSRVTVAVTCWGATAGVRAKYCRACRSGGVLFDVGAADNACCSLEIPPEGRAECPSHNKSEQSACGPVGDRDVQPGLPFVQFSQSVAAH